MKYESPVKTPSSIFGLVDSSALNINSIPLVMEKKKSIMMSGDKSGKKKTPMKVGFQLKLSEE